MTWVVEIGQKKDVMDPLGSNTKKDIENLRIAVDDVKSMQTYFLEGNVSENSVKKICEELLVDNVIQQFSYSKINEDGNYENKLIGENDFGSWLVEVRFRPGVTDNVGTSVNNGIKMMGVAGVESAKIAYTYIIKGNISQTQLEIICKKCLANDVIQTYKYKKIEGN